MGSTLWSTPQPFFDAIDAEFGFTLDVCALAESAKCERWYGPADNSLMQDWTGERFWMNPPYGRGQDVYSWVRKAYESARAGALGVCLLPVSTDTKWFREFCMKAAEIRFIEDRLWFELDGISARANHASMVVVFHSGTTHLRPLISTVPNHRQSVAQRQAVARAQQTALPF